MTLRITIEAGHPRVDAGALLQLGQVIEIGSLDAPLSLASDGPWKALVEHCGDAADLAVLIEVHYGGQIGELHSITPRAASRFGCSVVIEAETGDTAVIYRTQKAVEPTTVASDPIPAI